MHKVLGDPGTRGKIRLLVYAADTGVIRLSGQNFLIFRLRPADQLHMILDLWDRLAGNDLCLGVHACRSRVINHALGECPGLLPVCDELLIVGIRGDLTADCYLGLDIFTICDNVIGLTYRKHLVAGNGVMDLLGVICRRYCLARIYRNLCIISVLFQIILGSNEFALCRRPLIDVIHVFGVGSTNCYCLELILGTDFLVVPDSLLELSRGGQQDICMGVILSLWDLQTGHNGSTCITQLALILYPVFSTGKGNRPGKRIRDYLCIVRAGLSGLNRDLLIGPVMLCIVAGSYKAEICRESVLVDIIDRHRDLGIGFNRYQRIAGNNFCRSINACF